MFGKKKYELVLINNYLPNHHESRQSPKKAYRPHATIPQHAAQKQLRTKTLVLGLTLGSCDVVSQLKISLTQFLKPRIKIVILWSIIWKRQYVGTALA